MKPGQAKPNDLTHKRPPSLPSQLLNILLGRPTHHCLLAAGIQFVLIVAWHPVVFMLFNYVVNLAVKHVRQFWLEWCVAWCSVNNVAVFGAFPASLREFVNRGAALTAVVLLLGTVTYLPFRAVNWRRSRRLARADYLALFVRSWWQSCLLGLLILPLVGAVIATLLPRAHSVGIPLAIAGYLLFVPALMGRRQLRPQWRMARWRPECPECGYSLRRLESARCPECGQNFPTRQRAFRRWAVRRLPWDRVARGSLFVAYVRTLLVILICPCHAGHRVVIPDRWGRAVRWAIAHLLLLTLLGVAFGSDEYFWRATVSNVFSSDAEFPGPWAWLEPSGTQIGVWALQSLAAWGTVLAAMPALGMALSICVPRQHPAARRTLLKWCLYVSAAPAMLVFFRVAFVFTYWSVLLIRQGGQWGATFIDQSHTVAIPSPLFLAAVYGVCWAGGVAAQPYSRRRGWWVFGFGAGLYVACWLLLTRVLFSGGPLETLL